MVLNERPHRMTFQQKMVIFLGLTAVALMLVFPPVRVMVKAQDSASVSIHNIIRYQYIFTESIKRIHYHRLLQQCGVVLSLTIGFYVLWGRAEKSAVKRARLLLEVKSKLMEEIAENERVEDSLRDQNVELRALNEQLRHETKELNEAFRKLQEYQDNIQKNLDCQDKPELFPDDKSAQEISSLKDETHLKIE